MSPNPESRVIAAPYDPRAMARSSVELFEEHGDAVYRTALGLTGDPADAQDVVQEVFLSVLKDPRGLAHVESIPAWLQRAAVNAARKVHRGERRRAAREEVVGRAKGDVVDTSQDRAELLERLSARVAALPEALREAVVLHYWARLPYDRVAELLGCAPGTVGSRLSAARERLRGELATALGAAPLTLLDLEGGLEGAGAAARLPADAAGAIRLALRAAEVARAGGAAATSQGVGATAVVVALALAALLVAGLALGPGGGTPPPPPLATPGPVAAVATPTTPDGPAATTSAPTGPTASLPRGAEAAADPDVEAPAPDGPRLAVVVRDAEGRPVEGAEVLLVDASAAEGDGEAPDVPAWRPEATTDAEGVAELDGQEVPDRLEVGGVVRFDSHVEPLRVGRVLWVFARRGLEDGLAGPIELRNAGTFAVDVTLRRPAVPRPGRGTLLVTVTRGGAPLAGEPVRVNWLAPEGNGSRSVPTGSLDLTTDGEGRLVLQDLRPARYELSLRSETRGATSLSATLEAGETARCVAELSVGVAAEGPLVLGPGLRPEEVHVSAQRLGGAGPERPTEGVVLGGRWRVEGLQPGRWSVSAAARGWANGVAELEVGTAGPVAGPELRLGSGATVTGRVVDLAGAPVAGWRSMWITGDDGLNVLVAPGEGGAFTLRGVTPGRRELVLRLRRRVFDAMEAKASARLDVPAGAAQVELGDVRFPCAGAPWTLAGRVVDAAGAPVAGAEVELVRPGGWPLVTTRTDAGGRFSFTEARVGAVQVGARRFEQVSRAARLVAESGASAEVVLTLDQGTGALAGRFVCPGATPDQLAGGLVLATRVDPAGARLPFASHSQPLDGQGRFRFASLAPGRWSVGVAGVTAGVEVEVAAEAEATVELDFSAATARVDIVVEGDVPPDLVDGVELRWEGEPTPAGATRRLVGGAPFHALVGGRATFQRVAPGPVVAELSCTDARTGTRLLVRQAGVAASGAPTTITLRWPEQAPKGGLRGRVGSVAALPQGAVVWAVGPEVRAFASLDADGGFRLAGLPAGEYRLGVGVDDDAPGGTTCVVVAGVEAEVTLPE